MKCSICGKVFEGKLEIRKRFQDLGKVFIKDIENRYKQKIFVDMITKAE